MAVLKESAPAKVNFTLDILGRRNDGYHDMRMINHEIELADVLTFSEGKDIQLICDDPSVPTEEENLIFRTAFKMKRQYQTDKGVIIHLTKKIPMQAGLGGGSADAAAAIRGLNRFWRLDLSDEEMRAFGAGIGADVPYCISGGTALVEGFGDRITFMRPMPESTVLVLKPNINISTPTAFRMADDWGDLFHPKVAKAAACLNDGAWEESLRFAGNSFEKPIFARWPLIASLKAQCLKLGASHAAMSGSGSTVVAYFNDDCSAERAAKAMACEDVIILLSAVRNKEK